MFQRSGTSPFTAPLFECVMAGTSTVTGTDPEARAARTDRPVAAPARSRREPRFCRLPHTDPSAPGGEKR